MTWTNVPSDAVTTPAGLPASPRASLAVIDATLWTSSVIDEVYVQFTVAPGWSTALRPLSQPGLGTELEWSSPKAVIVSGVSALVFLATTEYVTVLPECTRRASPEVRW